jgi:hypothetical protein
MVQGTNFPPISQEKGVKKNLQFCNALKINNIKQHPVSLKLQAATENSGKILTRHLSTTEKCMRNIGSTTLIVENLKLCRTENTTQIAAYQYMLAGI